MRKKLNVVGKKQSVDDREYLLVKQLCSELGLDFMYGYMYSEGITTKILINCDVDTLLMALPEMERVHAAMIFLKVKDYLAKKKWWF